MQDFATKRKALFESLDDASKELKGTSLDQGDKPVNALKRNKTDLPNEEQNLSFMRGKESIFKKPERPITKCLKARKTPDYQMNPHKWMKYSLSDVDISDHTNTAAAFDFLRQMDEQRDAGYESQTLDAETKDGERKIEFKKSSKISRAIRAIANETNEVPDAEVDKPKLKGSKLIMPEYIVGQKIPKTKRGKANKKNEEKKRAAGTLKLSHLQEIEDEANDDNDIATER